ncbi:hypothetical protein F4780DRAFT_775175 [Xylariomycetidae sp. FL0641]|nr:hypothetical protein F4780DRAFT_775175 [Xylariomycetidae sp. FL0641]
MALSGNFAKDFVVALGVAAGATIALTIMVCVLAQCGPRMCGKIDSKERWLEASAEEGIVQHQAPPVVYTPEKPHPKMLHGTMWNNKHIDQANYGQDTGNASYTRSSGALSPIFLN